MRASLRAVFLALISSLAAFQAAHAEDDWPSYGVMTLEDHKAYFRPGAYLAYMDQLDITRRDVLHEIDWSEENGETIVTQTWSTVSVAENLLSAEPQPFVKMSYDAGPASMSWQPFRSGFIFTVNQNEVFDGEKDTPVWLSENEDLVIRPDDVEWGTEAAYYDEAYEETGGACCLSREEYEEVTAGAHVSSCSFVAHKTWEIMCISRHLETGTTWRTFFTRLEDAIG